MNVYIILAIALILIIPISWLIGIFIVDGVKVGLTITVFVLLFSGTFLLLFIKSTQFERNRMDEDAQQKIQQILQQAQILKKDKNENHNLQHYLGSRQND